jgi:hypothetical protein
MCHAVAVVAVAAVAAVVVVACCCSRQRCVMSCCTAHCVIRVQAVTTSAHLCQLLLYTACHVTNHHNTVEYTQLECMLAESISSMLHSIACAPAQPLCTGLPLLNQQYCK